MGSEITPGTSRSSPFIVEPTSNHTHSFILLHGLGSNGRKFGEELLETGVISGGKKLTEVFPGARFIFPTAKRRKSSMIRHAKLIQWFDIASLDDLFFKPHTQTRGLVESHGEITHLIKDECQKVSHQNVILGGLSHGCAMALFCLFTSWFPLGGFVGMSGWLPFQPDIDSLIGSEGDTFVFGNDAKSIDEDPFFLTEVYAQAEENPIAPVIEFYDDLLDSSGIPDINSRGTSLSTPVFLGHGAADEKIGLSNGEAAQRILKSVGFDVSWKVYQRQGHWYKIPDEIDDIVNFLQGKCGM
ncbi:Acyl-protein thioesterase 1 [Daldinia childiae]|uniref:Acyl-protein thioesterase 1 n=1 Tax=Daldinia childiae TaxID=326645 RepID=UPI001446E01E|nr:Acyl-protein thioesterase 1 [Daldinia childiae]KAF3059593.1 Acyl-protein thioesterase 1 [Daldinia childiae]